MHTIPRLPTHTVDLGYQLRKNEGYYAYETLFIAKKLANLFYET